MSDFEFLYKALNELDFPEAEIAALARIEAELAERKARDDGRNRLYNLAVEELLELKDRLNKPCKGCGQ